MYYNSAASYKAKSNANCSFINLNNTISANVINKYISYSTKGTLDNLSLESW